MTYSARMAYAKWTIEIAGKAKKGIRRLSKGIQGALLALLREMEMGGPFRSDWPNYGKLKPSPRIPAEAYHCHIKKGHPTYVACWRVVDKDEHIIEVFYVGTHEGSPY